MRPMAGGNTTAIMKDANGEDVVVDILDLMMPYDPPHCANRSAPSCVCDKQETDSRKAQAVVWRTIADILRHLLNQLRVNHPNEVKAFEFYYLTELTPTEAAKAAGMDRKTCEYRANWVVKQLRLREFGWYICPPLEGEHKRNYELWHNRQDNPPVVDKPYVTIRVLDRHGHKKATRCTKAGEVTEDSRPSRITRTQRRVGRLLAHGAHREARELVTYVEYVYRLGGGSTGDTRATDNGDYWHATDRTDGVTVSGVH